MIDEQARQELDRLLEDELEEHKREAVLKLLETDTSAVVYYTQQALLLTDLRQALKRRHLQQAISEVVPGFDHRMYSRRQRSWTATVAAAAAGILLAVILTLVTLQSTLQKRDGVAVHVLSSTVTEPANLWKPGSDLYLQHLTISSGQVALRLINGVTLDLTGPVSGEFHSINEFRLLYGSVVADVGEEGKGFIVQTPSAKIVDQGTRFGVDFNKDNQVVDVVVLQGLVDVYGTSPATPVVSLREGEAIRLDKYNSQKRPGMIRFSPDARRLVAESPEDVISDVFDNAPLDFSHNFSPRFYGFIRGGMGEGARAYTTGHTRTWHAPSGSDFPAELLGADIVCTNSYDRKNRNLIISMKVEYACDLYVLCDARNPIPNWIAEDYSDTGLLLECGSLKPVVNSNGTTSPISLTPHKVFKRHIPTAGIIKLGSPISDGVPDAGLVMYGIAVRRTPR